MTLDSYLHECLLSDGRVLKPLRRLKHPFDAFSCVRYQS